MPEPLLEKGNRAASSAGELEREVALFVSEIGQRQQTGSELDRKLQEKREEAPRAADDSRTVRESFSLAEKNLEDLKSQQLQKLFELTELRNESLKEEKELELLLRQETKLNVQLAQEESLLRAKEESLPLIDGELAEVLANKEEKEMQGRELRASLEERRSAVSRLKEWIEEARRSGGEDRYRLNALKKMEEGSRGAAGGGARPRAPRPP